MLEKQKTEPDIFFRNIELHSLGRKEYGTLVLARHHFVFRYHPGAKRDEAPASSSQDGASSATPTKPTTVPNASAGSARPSMSDERDTSGVSTVAGSDEKPAASTAGIKDGRHGTPTKQRQKEMWMPYPMINHCILRPSHSFNPSIHVQDEEPHRVPNEQGDDELFPPTFGTATYGRPSTDSAHLAPYHSPARSHSPGASTSEATSAFETGRQPAIRIRLKDFRMMALHFHPNSSGTPPDEAARQCFFALRSHCCVDNIRDFHAFHFSPPKEEITASPVEYDARREYARMGIGGKAADGPGAAWRISDINQDYSYSATYPSVLCVPRSVSDNMLKYGGTFRSRSRIPCLSYLHSNGGSITRSSQPMVGVQSKRNPQDERLVSAIFSSHTPPLRDAPSQGNLSTATSNNAAQTITSDSNPSESETPSLPISQSETALDEAAEEKATPIRQKIYGSTRRNLIVDARPKINALANRATGGGIEDVANYRGSGDVPVEKIFLNVANIHVMRASLEKVVDSFANSDYIKMKPDQEALRKSGWLGHIAGMLDGAEMIARVVGLGGSHVLVHCSDGWDRTAQISALAQLMLDPHSRTFAGFVSLIQKEFLSFGHKFRDRNGVEGSEKWFEIENERVAPSRSRDSTSDASSLNNLGAKAFTGAKNWFEKNRGNIFRQQNSSQDNITDKPSSRPPSPPPNPLLHSPPSSTSKEERPHRVSDKEVSPIFHQFLDTVYQLLHPNPNAFEFNEHFLCRLFYHVYSCQYGEFLFNTEKERRQYKDDAGSVWSHFLSRKREFINPDYTAQVDDPLLFPKRSGVDREVEVKWWYRLFKRDDGEMNVPRALVISNLAHASVDSSTATSFDERIAGSPDSSGVANGSIKAAKSASSLSSMNDSLAGVLSSMRLGASKTEPVVSTESTIATDNIGSAEQGSADSTQLSAGGSIIQSEPPKEPAAVEYEGDPLGVMTSTPAKKAERSGLDFAAFASQNAFRD